MLKNKDAEQQYDQTENGSSAAWQKEMSNVSYESYYENVNGAYPDEKPKRRGRRLALWFVVVAVIFFISGALLAGIIESTKNPYTPPSFSWPTPKPQMPGGGEEYEIEKPPEATPFPTEKPMAALDGQTPVLPLTGNPIPDIVDAVSPSVVGVVNYAKIGDDLFVEQGMGSGFFISSEGYVLTNAHVVQDAYSLGVTLLDGTELEAELVAKDVEGDIAVIYVPDANVSALKLGDSKNIRVGEYVLTVGNPLGRNYEGTVTMGIISARSRAVTIDSQTNSYIQTDAAINVGNSGGPLLNMQGEVIGMNTAKTVNAGYDEYGTLINTEGLGFALPINKVREVATQLITKGYVEHAALGVHIQTLNRRELQERELSNGILLVNVVRNSPADKAGLLPGDVILFYDGIRAEKQDVLVDYVAGLPVGTTMEFVIWRDGQEQTLKVELANQNTLDYDDVIEDAK